MHRVAFSLVVLTCLVADVYMFCGEELANPRIRAEFIACSTEHMPPVVFDVLRSCFPGYPDLDTLFKEVCAPGQDLSQADIRCLKSGMAERQNEMLEYRQSGRGAGLEACLDNIELTKPED